MYVGLSNLGLSGIRNADPIFTSISSLVNYYTGAWYDPSDITTLFQDSAGTTPVTLDGDPVGMIRDKGPNGAHLIQATAASRPIYHNTGGKFWLEFDGIDDVMSSAAASYPAQTGFHYSGMTMQRPTATATNNELFRFGGAVTYSRINNSTTSARLVTRTQDGAGTLTINSATNSVPDITTVVVDTQWATTSVDIAINGGVPVFQGTGTATGQTIPAQVVVLGNATNAWKFYGGVSARTILNTTNRAFVQTYLATKI